MHERLSGRRGPTKIPKPPLAAAGQHALYERMYPKSRQQPGTTTFAQNAATAPSDSPIPLKFTEHPLSATRAELYQMHRKNLPFPKTAPYKEMRCA